MARRFRTKYEFTPASDKIPLAKKLHLTRQQKLHLLKWSLYSLLCLFLLILQDVVMSRISIYGATTDLVPCAILLITVLADAHAGSMLCAGAAMMLYELAVYATGIFMGLTYWGRIDVFALTGGISLVIMLALYPLVRVIGKIGGETWTE